MSSDQYRLPTSVVPESYRVDLDLDLDAERFSGEVTISARIEEPCETVVLNGDGIDVSIAELTRPGTEPEKVAVEIHADAERIELRPSASLDPGPIELRIAFSASFNDQLVGAYLSRFTDAEGHTQTLATTQFEATHARKCFPCWDEPAFKATFELSLVVDERHEAVANSAEVGRTSLGDGRMRVSFAPTMVMSTYLVAFVAGPLEITDPVDVDGTPLRIVHVPGKGDLTAFALDCGAFALRYFTDYFDLGYPGDKLDLVAIPDFAFGAMENLGCVTFREVLLLIDPDQATQAELQRAADVINHELAHMWFGDLVTMSWWNGLWLNEAFATFMEMRCTDAHRPDWQRWVDFGLSRSQAFDTDSLAATRPIEYEVVSPEDAEGMFDILTYEKGAAVVRMLEQYLGEDEFRAGIRRYMQENQYGNAETTDLWDAIEAETGEPVRRIMDSWIFQGGFPLVSVTVDGAAVTFSSERMSYLGGDESPDTEWVTPMLFRWQPPGDGDPRTDRVLLEGPVTTTTLDAEPEWLVANAAGSGFFRTSYDPEALDVLAEVSTDELDATERYALVDDTYAALLAGRTSSMAFLNLLEAMSGESDRSVWQRLIGGIRQLDRLVDGEARERLQEVAHDMLAPPLANLGLSPRPDDDDRSRQLRGDLIRALGVTANDPEIQEEAKRLFATARRDPELVDTPLLAASVDVIAAIGNETDFADFESAWRSAATPQEEVRYLYALSDFSDPALQQRVQALILDGDIRSQNAPFLLARSLGSRDGGRATWAFITTEWARLNEMFPTSSIPRMLSGISALDHADLVEATSAFLAENPPTSGAQTVRQVLERQRVQLALREREAERLAAFLVASAP
ncbi:MAG: M1 family metallopeptidase [Actinomycetota bacterium]